MDKDAAAKEDKARQDYLKPLMDMAEDEELSKFFDEEFIHGLEKDSFEKLYFDED